MQSFFRKAFTHCSQLIVHKKLQIQNIKKRKEKYDTKEKDTILNRSNQIIKYQRQPGAYMCIA